MKKLCLIIIALFLATNVMQGQVLISLIFGNKLNSEKLKFGLDGGANFSTISNVGSSTYNGGFNLGFYFDILLKQDMEWYIHTGVIVKSPLGANNLDTYSLNDPDLDTVFMSGVVDRKLRYFNVPILVRYKFKFNLFAEVGPMVGLLYKANDEFVNTIIKKDDIIYRHKVVDQYNRLDIGVMGGLGYRFKFGHGVNLGLRYYYGFIDILKNNPGKPQRNSSFYIYASIPIGAGERAQAKAAAKAEKRAIKKEVKRLEKEQKKLEKKGS